MALTGRSYWSRVDPYPDMTGVLIKGGIWTCPQGECHVEIGVMLLHLSGTRKEPWDRDRPSGRRGNMAPTAP